MWEISRIFVEEVTTLRDDVKKNSVDWFELKIKRVKENEKLREKDDKWNKEFIKLEENRDENCNEI